MPKQTCPKCGYIGDEGDGYCYRCGVELIPESLNCIKCGKRLDEGDLFCNKCGTPTPKDAIPKPIEKDIEVGPPPRSTEPIKINYIALLILVVAIIVLGLFFLASNNAGRDYPPPPTYQSPSQTSYPTPSQVITTPPTTTPAPTFPKLRVDVSAPKEIPATIIYALPKETIQRDLGSFIDIVLSNAGDGKATSIKVKAKIPDYSDWFTENTADLPPGGTVSVSILPRVNKDILKLTSGSVSQINVVVEYSDARGKTYTEEASKEIILTGRNAFNWASPSLVASYITPQNEVVRKIATDATGGIATFQSGEAKMEAARRIFEELQAYGVRYTTDIQSDVLDDYVQFPIETLYNRGGDCEDFSILYASMLQAVGISSSIILIPQHAFVAFNAGDKLVPLEATMISSPSYSFEYAVNYGVEEFNKYPSDRRIIDMGSEWGRGVKTADFAFDRYVPTPAITKTNQSCSFVPKATALDKLKSLLLKSPSSQFESSGYLANYSYRNAGDASGRRCIYVGNSLTGGQRRVCENIPPGSTVSIVDFIPIEGTMSPEPCFE